jgi:hypothetical protein
MRIDRRFPPTWSFAKERLYQSEWAAVERTDHRADRHALHIKALGYDVSHVDFTDLEFGKVLEAFRAISNPADLFSELDAIIRRKQRLICSIQCSALKLNVIVVATIKQPIEELEAIRVGLSRQLAERKRTALALKAAA